MKPNFKDFPKFICRNLESLSREQLLKHAQNCIDWKEACEVKLREMIWKIETDDEVRGWNKAIKEILGEEAKP